MRAAQRALYAQLRRQRHPKRHFLIGDSDLDCATVRELLQDAFSWYIAAVDTLSENELDTLWELVKGHAPGDRAELRETLRAMAAMSVFSVKVTPHRVEVKLPLMVAAIDRQKRKQ